MALPCVTSGIDVLFDGNWEHCGVFYIYNRKFLLDNKLRFYPGIYHEDSEFTPRALYFATNVCVVPRVLYTVYRDENGITLVPRAKRAFDYLIVASSLYHFVCERNEVQTIYSGQ